jgi:hypothetical protein
VQLNFSEDVPEHGEAEQKVYQRPNCYDCRPYPDLRTVISLTKRVAAARGQGGQQPQTEDRMTTRIFLISDLSFDRYNISFHICRRVKQEDEIYRPAQHTRNRRMSTERRQVGEFHAVRKSAAASRCRFADIPYTFTIP